MTVQEEQQLNLLEQRCEELEKCNFILAEKKIAGVLQAIASSQTLCKVVKNCTQKCPFDPTFDECFSPLKDGQVYASGVRLPADPADCVALVFCIYMKIDGKEWDLYPFLNTYFSGDGSYFECWANFVTEVAVPFHQALVGLYKAVAESEELPAGQTRAPLLARQNAVERVTAVVQEQKKVLSQNRKLTLEEIKEICEVADGFCASLETGERDLIRLLYFGYKYALRSVKKEGEALKVYRILKTADLID